MFLVIYIGRLILAEDGKGLLRVTKVSRVTKVARGLKTLIIREMLKRFDTLVTLVTLDTLFTKQPVPQIPRCFFKENIPTG
jgi:hypothetical protein